MPDPARSTPNPASDPSAQQLRCWVPAALRAPAVGYTQRLGVSRSTSGLIVRRTIIRSILVMLTIGLLAAPGAGYSACNIIDGKAYGDCAGVRINEGIKDHLTVRSYTSVSGIIEDATVVKGGELDLSGISNGDITVHKGARLRLTGIAKGTVNNLGGNVEVEGVLNHLHTSGGSVVIGGTVGSVSGTGAVSYKKGAVVGGVPVDDLTIKARKQ